MIPLTERALVGEARCLQCGRTAAKAREWPGGVRLTPMWPEYAEAVRMLRCPFGACGGRLWIEDTTYEVVSRRHLTPDELVPRRGRPRKDEVAL